MVPGDIFQCLVQEDNWEGNLQDHDPLGQAQRGHQEDQLKTEVIKTSEALLTRRQTLDRGRRGRHRVVSRRQTFLHSAAEEGLASPHSIPRWEKNVLWFIAISLNQSELSWAVLSREELVLVKRVHSKVVLVVQQKNVIGQIV